MCIVYLDDVTLGGSLDWIVSDLELIKRAESLGLSSKSEIISTSDSTLSLLLSHLPGAQPVSPSHASISSELSSG